MKDKKISYIAAEHIKPHPENPRKNLGDLTELVESIKKNGILQNLTVIPIEGEPGEYMTIIGHRRYAAGVQAGVKAFPCQISENLTPREQMSIMLEENMQRNDLTICEQANGFQMMLDLGETEEGIAEKTGFSKATVKHRLNIAKLNQEELKKKEQDECFQLSLKDLYELEKISDVSIRNKILAESNSSRDLVSKVQNAVSAAKRESCKNKISGMLEKMGIEQAPKEVENEVWSSKWKTIQEFDLDKEPPKQLNLSKENAQMYWLVYYRTLKVIVKVPKEGKKLSEHEIKQQQISESKKQIKAVLKESSVRRKEFIQNIITGKIAPIKNEENVKDAIWQALLALRTYAYQSSLKGFFLDKEEYKCTDEEKQEAIKKVEELSILHQMLIILHTSMTGTNETYNYYGHFDQERGDALLKGYAVLEPYGWYFENESEISVLDGSHESYMKEK